MQCLTKIASTSLAILILVALVGSSYGLEWEWDSGSLLQFESTIGHQLEGRFSSDDFVQSNRPSISQRASYLFGGEHTGVRAVASYRLRLDSQRRFPNDQYTQFDIRQLTAEAPLGNFQTKIGIQEVVWGETFGFPIADIVNARDFSESLVLSQNEVRLAAFMVNTQWLWNSSSVQFLWIPKPRRSALRTNVLSVPVQENELRWFNDSELGLRVGHLFESGWDVKGFYLFHWNRVPVLETRLAPVAQLVRQESRVHSFGGSFSLALDEWVIRGDSVFQHNYPFQLTQTLPTGMPVFSSERKWAWQTILGTDYTSTDQMTVGLQAHLDYFARSSAKPELVGVGVQWRYPMFNYRVEPELLFFSGLNHHDRWLSPKIHWNLTASLRASAEWHWLAGTGDGYFPTSDYGHRLVSRLRYQF